MKRVLGACAIAMLVMSAPPAGAADPLPQRVAFDAMRTTPDQWDRDEGMEVAIEPDSGIVLKLKNKPHASAAPMDRVAYDESARVTLKIGPPKADAPDFTIQIEWLDARGQLVEAVKAATGEVAVKGFDSRAVSEFLPESSRDKIKKFRVKLWLGGGDGTSITVTDLRVTTDRHWRAKDVELRHTFDATSKVEADKGIIVKPQANPGGAILLTIEPGTPFSACTLTDRAPYDPAGVVMLDLGQMRGSVTLQVLCWSESGDFLKAVDLMKDVLETGTYETPFTAYAKQIPPATKQISFKVWLGGKQPYAWLQGIFYGVAGGKS